MFDAMAKMLPSDVPDRVPKHVARVCSAFRRIKCDDIECRLSYSLDGKQRPELLVIYKSVFAAIVAVSDSTDSQIEEMVHGSLFDESTISEGLKLRECHLIEQYLDSVCESMGMNAQNLGVEKWIVIPSASQVMVDRLAEMLPDHSYLLIGKDNYHPEALLQVIVKSAENPLDRIVVNSLKSNFSPEASIPHDWIPQSRIRIRDNKATQTDFLLDYNQELAVKRDLELSSEAESGLNAQGLRLVTGVAGCGKTLVLVFRARLAARLNKDAKILILTHNKPLCSEWNHRMKSLDPAITVEWRTFYQWVRAFMLYEPLFDSERFRIIRELRAANPDARGFTDDFISAEFGWITDNMGLNPDPERYLNAVRYGRKRALSRSHREVVLRLFYQYYSKLKEVRKQDWEQIPALFLEKLKKGTIRLPSYDAIFIDEAQYFAPVWFECVKMAMTAPHCQLFMVADPTQGFLRQGQSWLRVLGQEIRGRSQRLMKPYRNTGSILEFAKRFYLSRVAQDDEEINLPSEDIIRTMPVGSPPRMIQVSTFQDEKNRIINEVCSLLENGVPASNILIIHCYPGQNKSFEDMMEQKLPGMAKNGKDRFEPNKIRMVTLNSCGGIEARIVFILEADYLFSLERDFRLEEGEREELILKNTRRIFVALTRATEKVVITYKNDDVRRLLVGGDLQSGLCPIKQ